MKANGIERDFLKEVREARPEDCKAIIAALYALEGRKDTDGELTSLGSIIPFHTIRRLKAGRALLPLE